MKIDFFELLASAAGGVFRSHDLLPDAALESAARKQMLVIPVKLATSRDKNAFLTAIAKALQFPDYFGHNWDAFYDCLLELELQDGAGMLLLLRGASAFARAEPEEFAAALGALADASDYWGQQKKTLLIVVELEVPGLAPELAEISRPPA